MGDVPIRRCPIRRAVHNHAALNNSNNRTIVLSTQQHSHRHNSRANSLSTPNNGDENTRETDNVQTTKRKMQQTLIVPSNTTTTIILHMNAIHEYQTTGNFTSTEQHQDKLLIIANSISAVRGKEVHTRKRNPNEQPYTLKMGTTIATFQVQSPEQT